MLNKILYEAAGFFDDRDAAGGYEMTCFRTLCLAAYLVDADGSIDGVVDDHVANEIAEDLGDIANFVLEANGLSPATRARLERIKHAGDDDDAGDGEMTDLTKQLSS